MMVVDCEYDSSSKLSITVVRIVEMKISQSAMSVVIWVFLNFELENSSYSAY